MAISLDQFLDWAHRMKCVDHKMKSIRAWVLCFNMSSAARYLWEKTHPLLGACSVFWNLICQIENLAYDFHRNIIARRPEDAQFFYYEIKDVRLTADADVFETYWSYRIREIKHNQGSRQYAILNLTHDDKYWLRYILAEIMQITQEVEERVLQIPPDEPIQPGTWRNDLKADIKDVLKATKKQKDGVHRIIQKLEL
jgi:hypothetical protein